MLPTIGLCNQPCFEAGEIGDERANRTLAAEFCDGEMAAAENLPKFAFRVGSGLAELAGAFDGGWAQGPHPPIAARWAPPSPASR
jgi:hypothetical protein